MATIFQPSFMYPYGSCVDLSEDIVVSAKVNGIKIDSYQLKFYKNVDGSLLWDSGKVSLSTPLPTKNQKYLEVKISANTITFKGEIKWTLTYWNGDESITSQEKIFYNMTTPIINLSLPTQLASSQVSFTATYSQAENIQLKSWQAALYPVSYRLDGGHIIERADGSVLDSGHITDLINKSVEKRYSLDEGHINDLIEKIKKSGEEG